MALSSLALLAACGSNSSAAPQSSGSGGGTTRVVLAQPVHNYLFMPLYAAIDNGYFSDQGIDASVVTASGGNHVNAVLTGEAWGFIGGLDSIAVADQRGGGLVAVSNINDQNFNALTARTGIDVGTDVFAAMKGKTVVTGRVGGTPDTLLKVLLKDNNLVPNQDVKIINVQDDPTSLAVVQKGTADFIFEGTSYILKGVAQGFLQPPTFNASNAIGPMAYTVIGAKSSSVQSDPELAQKIVTALVHGVEFLENNPTGAKQLADKEFSDQPEADRAAVIDAIYKSGLWTTPTITEAAFDKNMGFARLAGTLDDAANPVSYSDIVNMTFVQAAPPLK